MELFQQIIQQLNTIVSGPILLPLLAGTGLFLSIGYRFIMQRNIFHAFKMLLRGRKKSDKAGDLSPFNALMTSMSAAVGTGNIAGVATAIYLGGPGALFWMWVVAIIGMATSYSEAALAVLFREKDPNGNYIGGPMFYIRKGLGERWKWLAFLFALFGMLAGAGIGNTVQSNSIGQALEHTFQINPMISGIVVMVIVGLVLIGGIKRIGEFAGRLVPFMAIAYFLAGVLILVLNITEVPAAIGVIIKSAFTSQAASGGFLGATVWSAIRYGIARGIFSNEAGMGSSPIAHATAQTDSPQQQGVIAMLGVFLDTIVICSITGLSIVITGAWKSGHNGAAMSVTAFENALPGFGQYIVSIGLVLFALTTIIGWSLYSEKCTQYLFGVRSIKWFRIIWVLIVPFGTFPFVNLEALWSLADLLNALMAIPNLIALLLLSPILFQITKEYWAKKKDEE
ncbi:MAG: sodium:alanine symporter family protein [Oxalobacter sp.]|nr:sodium:alanine symporter family protein [Oxalobacter sp.]